MKIVTLLILIIILPGCANLDYARTQAVAVADESLALGHRLSCTSSSVGAVFRKYGRTAEDFNRWVAFCWGDSHALLRK